MIDLCHISNFELSYELTYFILSAHQRHRSQLKKILRNFRNKGICEN